MPIPLIIGVAAGAAGLYKAGKAISDNSEASSINDDARSIARSAERKLDESRKNCQKSLQRLGQKKADIYAKNVKEFIPTFEQIKNVEFNVGDGLGNLTANQFNDVTLAEMRQMVDFILESGLGMGSGSLAGALTAFGAYNGTMMFAAASTGTAISTLSGAAATNATLAWLGGGSLASGGMGVAGGTMALGALAAGPAVLVAGWYMGSKAEKALDDARSNRAQARKFAADADAAAALSNGISEAADSLAGIISGLAKYSRRGVKNLANVIVEQGTDYSQYNEEAKNIVLRNVKLMQVIKASIDTEILDKKGNLLGDAATNLRNLRQDMKKITA